MTKTNAMRILEKLGVPFSVHAYEENPGHLPGRGLAEAAAEKAGLPPERVFKTVVMRSSSAEILVFCVPAASEVNLKKARAAAGVKDLRPLKPEELPAATGYIRGGCSPVGMKRPYRTFIDGSAAGFGSVFVSAGVCGMQMELAPADLVRAANAVLCDVAGDA
ncbi:MAG: aminoacyl-tRNA deacylase [Spirochaetes bacterium]|uniref:Cys-tRNA(Pro)/Cys-tRNA(Cys) deacylase n=1 Tax=Candidatus Avitreponema avistercoris TaxID=2840705 RepID=A0A9D9HHX2_9SPIR|nr:aminoacyl-tRNA deacylase [Candidatus Avitreponema avistercoris]